MKLNKDIVFVFLIIVLLWWIIKPVSEVAFNPGTYEFVPIGSERYGLRGDKLKRSDISNLYMSPERNIRLSHSTGEMWESEYTPESEGIAGCRKVQCPTNHNGYDSLDTCWKCGNECPQRTKIPYIHPH